MSWETLTAEKRRQREALLLPECRSENLDSCSDRRVIDVPNTCVLLSEEELAITRMSAVDLVKRMREGQLTSYDVTLAFCKRASITQQLVCLSLLYWRILENAD